MRLLYLKMQTELIAAILLLIQFAKASNCQFISYFDAKGLRGNLTFNLKEGAISNLLVISSYIESSPVAREKLGSSEPTLFEWSIHTNTLHSGSLTSCTNDDLGPVASFYKSLTDQRPIVLNALNQWTVPIDDILQSIQVKSLSSLIWGKSIRVKLSSKYSESASVPSFKNNSTGNINKPTLKTPSTNASVTFSKPVFAPRPKPNISTPKLKTPTISSLPIPEALIFDSTSIEPGASLNVSQAEDIRRYVTKLYGKFAICGNIIDTRSTKTVKATFDKEIGGEIVMRGNEDDTTVILSNLYHIKSKITTRHDWKILASDILDDHRHGEQCRHLQAVFDPNNLDNQDCKRDKHAKCRMGDLVGKHGQIHVAGQGKNAKSTTIDFNLPLSYLESSRSLFIIIYEVASAIKANGPSQKQGILSCAQIKSMSPRKVEANFNMDGVRGTVRLTQNHFTEPTFISFNLFGLEGNIKHQSIRELPLADRASSENSKLCNSLGQVFNPLVADDSSGVDKFTVDHYAIGNLSGKHGQLSIVDSEYEDHYMSDFMDLSVQLYGIHSIVGRSIVIHKNNGESWVCSTLNYIDEPMSLAAATFYYPVVGQVTFQQARDDPHGETGVLLEVYNPNGDRDTIEHDWKIHLKPAMSDFYNWSQRCESSGEIFDPIHSAVGLTSDQYNRQCQTSFLSEPLRCRLGDVSTKSGSKISLPKSHLNRSRFYYVDPFLPLSQSNSIIGRSVVIYDEHAPTQRGNRLACSTIKSIHPLKAIIKSWSSGPSIPSAVLGSIEFEQEYSLKPTRINIDLNGFNGNVENYGIHSVWTMEDREFPCSNDSLYDIYDPYDNENSLRLPPSAHYGSLATVDRVKVGDMSKKHGTFEGLQAAKKILTDANIPLFAPRSIIGRSMVLRAAVNDFRWVCGNIELDYDRSKSRQIVAIASFDEPRSKVSGYVRFTQIEHKDGSLSDTYAQIDLKLQSDGIHELETSTGHNWAIFVNQVGEDAFIAAEEVRCLASGFKWNPYLAQDNSETYPDACTSTEHRACAMGDLGMRHGPLTLGPNYRRVISDSNLPLVGNYSIMARSLVIFDSRRPSLKLACANIYPDIHLKSNVVIKRMPSFTVARFVETMRSLIGAADWLLVPELEATKPVANGECVQMTIHFYGQKAHQMQIELNNLISLGTVRKSTRSGSDKISTHYKLCRTTEMQLTSSANDSLYDCSLLCILVSALIALIISSLNSTKGAYMSCL